MPAPFSPSTRTTPPNVFGRLARKCSLIAPVLLGGLLLTPACGDPEIAGQALDDAGGSSAGGVGSSGDAGGSSTAPGGLGGASESGGASGSGGTSGSGGALLGSGGTDGGTAEPLPLAGQPCSGYTLITSTEGDWGEDFGAFLVDMDGDLVHQWELTGFPPKMLPGGDLLGCTGLYTRSYDCMELQQKTWDGEIVWSFSGWVETSQGPSSRNHHDLQRAGNPVGYYAPGQRFEERGDTLVLAHLEKTVPAIRDGLLDDDVLYEVDFDGQLTGFEWHAADHVAEFGFDERALEDIRTRSPGGVLEWLHGNAVSRLGPNHWYDGGDERFHPDNIIYSSRLANFLIIIDQVSGDVVWRVGPDFAGRPEEALGQFSGQHMAHMIPEGLPGAGNILVFDNGGRSGFGGTAETLNADRYYRGYSRVVEFDPVDLTIVWEYGEPTGETFMFSSILGAVQRLPNGNTLVTLGLEGHVFEVTPQGERVWDYQFTGAPVDRSTGIWVYRASRVPPEWLPDGINESAGNYPSWERLFEVPPVPVP